MRTAHPSRMRVRPRSPGRSSRAVRTVAAVAVAGLGLLGFVQPTAATAAVGGPDAPAGTKVSVTPACDAPRPGEFSCFALRRTETPTGKDAQPATASPSGLNPADLVAAYKLPADGGAGATIAVVDAYDDPSAEADMAAYRQQFGLPACTTDSGCFTKADQNGGTSYPAPNANWAGEISLDLDMISAVAPKAHIILVEATTASFANLGTAVDRAVLMGAQYVSNSYGSSYDSSPGSGEDPNEATLMDPYYDHPGVAMVVSAGDGAYGVAYPAASPYVTSVGGTSLVKDSSTRGWSESVWNGTGSGCSAYEPKPAFQSDSGCAHRAVTDVSAVADPMTGVSVYQTYGGSGWAVYGGTSASAPIITGVYANAGPPKAGTYPNSYPYTAPGALNDVTSGDNGECSPAYLCTAGDGYDGPTGLGTPNGLSAFRSGPHGEVKGKVTDASGAPVAAAEVTVGDNKARTGADGSYDLKVPVGTYDITVNAYGYHPKTVSGVAVAEDAVVAQDVVLIAVPRVKVSGHVTDASGKGWPLYATVAVDGMPGAPAHTDPRTGAYSLELPAGADYTLHATPYYGGYLTADASVSVGTSDVTADIAAKVDDTTCTAPGYAMHHHGQFQTFDGTTAPDGWTVTDNTDGGGWEFDDPGKRTNLTGGTGGFAVVDSDHDGIGRKQDTYLTSPVADLSDVPGTPVVEFDTTYYSHVASTAEVQVSTDGGGNWSTVWSQTTTTFKKQHVAVALPQVADRSATQVRFHYTGSYSWFWEVDDVLLGSDSCDTAPAGLVVGKVTDQNTGDALPGALVADAGAAGVSGTSVVLDDAGMDGAFYWFLSPDTGSRTLKATAGRYSEATDTVDINDGGVAEADFAMKAGRIEISPGTAGTTLAWGGKGSSTVTVKNTGSAPATLDLSTTVGSFTMQGVQQNNAPVQSVPGPFPSGEASLATANESAAEKAASAAAVKAAADAPGSGSWTPIANYPLSVQDDIADYVGDTLYAGYGYTGSSISNDYYSYDAGANAWTKMAGPTDRREAPAHAAIGGKVYVVGGWSPTGAPDPTMEVYDSSTNTWSLGTSSPAPYAGSGSAAMGGKLYVVGGCASTCGTTDAYSFDPSAGAWTKLAPYPEPVAWEACGPVAGKLYCAGGTAGTNGTIQHTYAYNPTTDNWSQVADMPASRWGGGYTVANGQLLVQNGIVNSGMSNTGVAYDPAADSWTALPNTATASYRLAGALGFYTIGGTLGSGNTLNGAQLLSGYDMGEDAGIGWLKLDTKAATLAPGQSVTVTLAFDASDTSVVQPGTYHAILKAHGDTPYLNPVGDVAMTVQPPADWGKVAGTVSYADSSGTLHPIGGAVVQLNGGQAAFTLRTDGQGRYQYWLDVKNNPVTEIVAKDGYVPQTQSVKLKKGGAVTKDYVLTG